MRVECVQTDNGFVFTNRFSNSKKERLTLFEATTTKQYSIVPSMSICGNPYDNAMAENFFSILKTECTYRLKPSNFSEANEMIDHYIYFYNHERIQLKTGEAPLARRLSA